MIQDNKRALDKANEDRIDAESSGSYEVTITETLKKIVNVDAGDSDEAEQMVSDRWRAGDYILDADNFIDVEFTALPVIVQRG